MSKLLSSNLYWRVVFLVFALGEDGFASDASFGDVHKKHREATPIPPQKLNESNSSIGNQKSVPLAMKGKNHGGLADSGNVRTSPATNIHNNIVGGGIVNPLKGINHSVRSIGNIGSNIKIFGHPATIANDRNNSPKHSYPPAGSTASPLPPPVQRYPLPPPHPLLRFRSQQQRNVLPKSLPPQSPPLPPSPPRHIFSVGLGIGAASTNYLATSNTSVCGSVTGTALDGSVSVGYQYPISKNCRIGVEIGADFGTGGKILNFQANTITGRQLNLQFTRGVLAQMLMNISNNICGFNVPWNARDNSGIIHSEVWPKFAKTMRYLGGNSAILTSDEIDFIQANPNNDNVFRINNTTIGNSIPNENAVFANFVSNAIPNICTLGNGNIISGMQQLRTFITNNYSHLSYALANLASTNVYGILNTSVTHCLNPINLYAAENIAEIFRGQIPEEVTAQHLFGLPEESSITLGEIAADIARVFNPSPSDNIAPTNANPDVQVKTTFGICPHVAFKIGYFMEEIDADIYVKVGAMQLNAKFGIEGENIAGAGIFGGKLRKVTPFFAIGIAKEITDDFHMNVELSHALKTKAQFDNADSRQNIDVSKSSLKVMLVYHLPILL
ncbi:MAG: hypothetical protein LBT90_01570 [Holosporaceae bacterium]|nr:hypothetical protein [Holosporaceae bacterium]